MKWNVKFATVKKISNDNSNVVYRENELLILFWMKRVKNEDRNRGKVEFNEMGKIERMNGSCY